MASKKGGKNRLVASLVGEDYGPCAFCQRTVNDEVGFGKLYAIGDIYCHYFCVLLSCCLVQKGEDDEGLLGFLYMDILAEVERSKKHKCSFCNKGGATLGCAVSQCRKQFHLPCGRERNSLSLFYGNYKSFCEKHAPRQQIAESIMSNVRERQTAARKRDRALKTGIVDIQSDVPESVCVICYEPVDGFPSPRTFWPPCCGRDAWFHRTCLERMSLSAGAHFLKCPLCNDKDTFYRALTLQGYYAPDRDAAWELENAFADIYSRPVTCTAPECNCRHGRDHDMEHGPWDIKLCLLCGGAGSHLACLPSDRRYFVCATCQPTSPADLDDLEQKIAKLIREEEEAAARAANSRPVMPSRMSIRRTKMRANAQNRASSSRATISSPMVAATIKQEPLPTEEESDLVSSRLDLNLKSPKKLLPHIIDPSILAGIEDRLISPIQYLEEKLLSLDRPVQVDSRSLLERLQAKFRKPRPRCAMYKIVDAILSDILNGASPSTLERSPTSPTLCTAPPERSLTSPTLCTAPPEMSLTSPTLCTAPPEKSLTSPTLCTAPPEMSLTSPTLCTAPPEKSLTSSTVCTAPPEMSLTSPTLCTPPKIDGNVVKTETSGSCPDASPAPTTETPSQENTTLNTPPETMVRLDVKSPLIEESSNSTFVLPAEFIAESDDSLPILDTPKKSTTVDIEKNSSLEISEHNEEINIDVQENKASTAVISMEVLENLLVISPLKNRSKFAYIPCNKEAEYKTVGIDLEDFKNQYLNELEKKHECEFNHNHEENDVKCVKFKTAIDFALEAAMNKTKDLNDTPVLKDLSIKEISNDNEKVAQIKDLNDTPVLKDLSLKEISNDNKKVAKKRKVDNKLRIGKKRKIAKKKKDKYSLRYNKHENSVQIKLVYNHESPRKESTENTIGLTIASTDDPIKKSMETIDLTIQSNSPPRKKTKKIKKKSKNSKELKLKIRFKSESFKKKREKKKKLRLKLKAQLEQQVPMKQTILQFSPDYTSTKEMIVKPDVNVTPMKRKYIKQERQSDSFKQTSIQSFFKLKLPDNK